MIYSFSVFDYDSISIGLFGQTDDNLGQGSPFSPTDDGSNSPNATTFTPGQESSPGFVAKGTINSVISVPAGKWLAVGNWSITFNNGNLSLFEIATTWYNSSGTNAHTHELTNFIPTDLEQLVALDSLDNNVLEGFTDVGTNGQISWTQVPTTISFNAGKIINVSLDDTKTNQHFAAQPLMGIVNSFVRCSDTPTPNMAVLPPCSANTFAEDNFNYTNTTTLYAPSEVLPPSEGSLGTEQELPYEDSMIIEQLPSGETPASEQELPPGETPASEQELPPSKGSLGTEQELPYEDSEVIEQELPSGEGLQPEDNPPSGEGLQPEDNQCEEVSITNVTASGFETDPADYHPPNHAVDGDSATWWSNKNENSWIQLDLGGENLVCGLSIEWNKGDTRKYTFEIRISKDGNDFTKVFEGTNNGSSSTPENYEINSEDGRYLRVSFLKTSSEEGWVSIKEIHVYANPIK